MVGPVDKGWTQMMSLYPNDEVSRCSEREEYEWLLGSPRSLLEEPLSHTWRVFESESPLERQEWKERIYAQVIELLLVENIYVTSYDVQIIFLLVFCSGLEHEKEKEMLRLLYLRGIGEHRLKRELQRNFPKNSNNLERLSALEMYIDLLGTEGR